MHTARLQCHPYCLYYIIATKFTRLTIALRILISSFFFIPAVMIGHVDAGKSTISGQILLLTNQVDERTIAKYEKEAKDKNRESWYLGEFADYRSHCTPFETAQLCISFDRALALHSYMTFLFVQRM
jgi:hypothetical protein